MFRLKSIGFASIVVLLGIAGCGADETGGFAQTSRALSAGRTIGIQVPDGTSLRLERATIGSDARIDELASALANVCADTIATRFRDVTSSTGRTAPKTCDVRARVQAQQEHLCMGHQWMTLASAIKPLDVFIDGRTEDRAPLEEGERISERETALTGRGLSFTIPIPDTDSRGSFRILATEAFRAAALEGAEILDADICDDGVLTQTVPGGRSDGGEGLSSDRRDDVSLAFVVTGATAEAMSAMVEAAEAAEDAILAEADARRSRDRDGARAAAVAQYGRHNSRSEAFGLWAGSPEHDCHICYIPGGQEEVCSDDCYRNGELTPLCDDMAVPCDEPEEPPPTGCTECWLPGGESQVCPYPGCRDAAGNLLPNQDCVGPVDCPPPPDDEPEDDPDDVPPPRCDEVTPELYHAVAVLRAVRVDPRTGVNRSEDALLDDIQAALREDHPVAFGGDSSSSTRAWLAENAGADADELIEAAKILTREARTLGRTIRPVREEGQRVLRVTGTQESAIAPDPAYYFAEQVGVARFDDTVDERTGVNGNAASRTYAERGVLQAFDFVASKLRGALERVDVRGGSIVDVRSGSPAAMVATALGYARSVVPSRVRVDIGAPDEKGGVDQVRVRIFGLDETDENYELWWGRDGLECATTQQVSGQGCALEDHQIPARAVSGTDRESGFADKFLEFAVRPSDLPLAYRGEAIPGAGRIYVTVRRGTSREALTGFGLEPGPQTGAYSRSMLVPVGRAVVERAAASVEVNPLDCPRPRTCCGDVDCDLRVPLESEVIEAAAGRDAIESSYRYFIQIAKDAAARADFLGEEVVLTGLEMDRRAESAREELEALCGGVVNVEALTPTACADDTGCDGGSCVEGVCIFGPDTAGLERCLGHGELVTAAMGDRPACYFVSEGIPCHCDVGEDCPVCPVAVNDEASCQLNLFPGAPMGATTEVSTMSLGFSVSDFDGHESFSCHDLVRLRAGQTGTDVIAEIANSPWFNEAAFRELAHWIGYDPELLSFGYTNRGGSPWFGTGTLQNGPNADDAFPCAPHPLAEGPGGLCGNPPQNGRPFLCGAGGSCSDVRARREWSHRVGRALYTVGLLGNTTAPRLFSTTRTIPIPDDYIVNGWACPQSEPTGGIEHLGEDGETACLRFGNVSTACVDLNGGGINCRNGTAWGSGWGDNYGGISPSPAWLTTVLEGLGASISDAQIVRRTGFAYNPDDPELNGGPYDGSCILLSDGSGSPGFPQLFEFGPGDAFTGGLLEATDGALCPMLTHVWPVNQPGVYSAQVQDDIFRTNSHGHLYRALQWAENPVHHSSPDDTLISEPIILFNGEGDSPAQLSVGDALDAMELACLATHERREGGCLDVLAVPDVNTLDDLGVLAGLLSCGADEIEGSLERMVLFEMPQTVAEDVAAGNIDPTFPIYRGAYGQSVAELRGTFESVVMSTRHVASTLRDFSADLRLAEAQINQLNIELELLDIEEQSLTAEPSFMERLGEVAKCGKAVFDAASTITSFNPSSVGKVVDAAQTCGSLAQGVSNAAALQQIALQEEALGLQQTEVLIQITLSLGQRIDALAASASELAATYSRINGVLAQLNQQRASAGRAAANVLLQDVDSVGREYNVNTVMRRRYNTANERYEEARRSAIRLAYLARRATEQRFGVDLSEMDVESYGTGEAPSAWVDTLCTSQGIDYNRIRDYENEDNYAEAYLGDWLEKLETFADTYQVTFPLQDEIDTTVISLRDDIYRERIACDLEGWNLLLWSSDPSHTYDVVTGGWAAEASADGYSLVASALPETPFGESEGALPPEQANALGGATAARLAYALPALEPEEGATPELPWWTQGLTLADGDHLLSWYERVATMNCEMVETPADSGLRVEILAADGSDITTMDAIPLAAEPWEHACWRRYFVPVSNPVSQDVRVRFRPRVDPTDALEFVDFAAPQLEMSIEDATPNSYFSTDEDLSWPAASCEDTTGDQFRADNWQYVCEPICPDGTVSCPPGEAGALPERCFWESTFALSLEELEQRELLPEGGISLGSFNYRMSRFAVNVVGTAVRDCEDSDWPTTCNASAFLPVSLRHDGPYEVRSYDGSTYLAPLFDGEAPGKALVAERYVTNPVSSADRSLLEDYWRTSFAGRPLAGRYRLRIEDVPSLQWDRVQDVQLVVQYGFWTRFD
ncbi:MAG: hypothetical protein AAGE52_33305 [Myxococcota bacterium]